MEPETAGPSAAGRVRRPAAPSACTVRVARRDGLAVASLAGELDISSVAEVRHQLRDLMVDGEVDLLLDLAELGFIDSAGLGALVAVHRQARVFRGSVALVAPTSQVVRALEITALNRVFACFATLDEAVAATTTLTPRSATS